MKSRTVNFLYWALTILFSAVMLIGVMQTKTGQKLFINQLQTKSAPVNLIVDQSSQPACRIA